jgi:TPR repeat protein
MAVQLWQPLGEQGNASVQYSLGSIYYEGRKGVPQDYTEAVRWWRLSAEQGLAEAPANLGVMYDNGRGVPQDYAEARTPSVGKAGWIRLPIFIRRPSLPRLSSNGL